MSAYVYLSTSLLNCLSKKYNLTIQKNNYKNEYIDKIINIIINHITSITAINIINYKNYYQISSIERLERNKKTCLYLPTYTIEFFDESDLVRIFMNSDTLEGLFMGNISIIDKDRLYNYLQNINL